MAFSQNLEGRRGDSLHYFFFVDPVLFVRNHQSYEAFWIGDKTLKHFPFAKKG
jgi:hypothetical protein